MTTTEDAHWPPLPIPSNPTQCKTTTQLVTCQASCLLEARLSAASIRSESAGIDVPSGYAVGVHLGKIHLLKSAEPLPFERLNLQVPWHWLSFFLLVSQRTCSGHLVTGPFLRWWWRLCRRLLSLRRRRHWRVAAAQDKVGTTDSGNGERLLLHEEKTQGCSGPPGIARGIPLCSSSQTVIYFTIEVQPTCQHYSLLSHQYSIVILE